MHSQAVSRWSSRPQASTSTSILGIPLPREACPLVVGSLIRGYEWEDALGQFCLLTDVVPTLGKHARSAQTEMVLDQLEALLDRLGFTFQQVLRTWFLLDDILAWYGDFNHVRTKFYSERGLLGRAPASTAVGVFSEQRGALTAHLLAWRPGGSGAVATIASSPFQGSAIDYGSAFSRGMLLEGVRGKRLYVSGTASIDASGSTLYPDSCERQISETFRVVRAMLERHGLGLADVVHAQGYLPDLADVELLAAAWSRALKLQVNFMQADICRRDLRFEIELIAERLKTAR